MLRRPLRVPRALPPCLLVAALAAPGLVAGGPTLARKSADAWASARGAVVDAIVSGPPAAAAQTRAQPARRASPASRRDGPTPTTIIIAPTARPADVHACTVPGLDVAPSDPCATGAGYPACTWRIPDARDAGAEHGLWRNTADDHRRGRPALVALLLAASVEYARRYPGERVVIGDLDAPGPRHETHENGVDADVYLPNTMEVENLPGNELVENYATLTPLFRLVRQERVETLARALATCSNGRLRILYNDADVRRRFLLWYRDRGFTTPFGAPMRAHNDLHRFHFHVSIPEDLEVLPFDGGPDDEPDTERVANAASPLPGSG